MLKTWKIARKFMEIRTILYQRIQTLIKLVFLFNNRHELFMSLIMSIRDKYFIRKRH